ncbi:MAG: peptide deformylase [Clostridiales bacterium]|mgnify:CR=1 FL=1|jgi:peptide deformylase|nr:peptide deformylase [Clostridiales bacterium]
MALRQIKDYMKDDVLRKKAKYVEKIDARVQTLVDDMIETMYHADGVGLAAPQVGVLKRIIVIDVGEGVHVLINPEIIEEKGEQTDYEGCLSVPGVRAQVKRPEEVLVRALDRDGNEVEIRGNGLMARALCHEIDHLNGVLFLDRAVPGTVIRESNEME